MRGTLEITAICNWAKQLLSLNANPSYRTVLNIIRNGDHVEMKALSTQTKMKKELGVASMRIENEMISWV